MEVVIDSEMRSVAAEQIRRAGLRVTPQRVAILSYLSTTDCHPTADEVGQAVNDDRLTVSRASIYNVLHSLRRSGLVREVIAGNAVTRYDAKVEPHHHFFCRLCGRVDDVPWRTAQLCDSEPIPGAVVDGYEVVYHGQCTDCAVSPIAPERHARREVAGSPI